MKRFELYADPTEHVNVVQDNAATVASLKQILSNHAADLFSPLRGATDPAACAAATGTYDGFGARFFSNI